MPVMDGYEATEALREFYEGHPQPKVVACTGHDENESIQKAWRHDMDEIISKLVQRPILVHSDSDLSNRSETSLQPS